MNQYNELKNIYDSLEDKVAFLNEFPVDIREHVNTSLLEGNEELFNQVINGGSSFADISNGNSDAIPTVGVEEPAIISQDSVMDPLSATLVGEELPPTVVPAPGTEVNPAPEVVENIEAEQKIEEAPMAEVSAPSEIPAEDIENIKETVEEPVKEAPVEEPKEEPKEEPISPVEAVVDMNDEVHNLSDEDIDELNIPEETKAGISKWRDASAKQSEQIMLATLNSIHSDFSGCEACDSDTALPESVAPEVILFKGADIANTLFDQGLGKTSLSVAVENYNLNKLGEGLDKLAVSKLEMEDMFDMASDLVDEIAIKYNIALTPADKLNLIEKVIDNSTFDDDNLINKEEIKSIIDKKNDFSEKDMSKCLGEILSYEFSTEELSETTRNLLAQFGDFSTAYSSTDEALSFFQSRDFAGTSLNSKVPAPNWDYRDDVLALSKRLIQSGTSEGIEAGRQLLGEVDKRDQDVILANAKQQAVESGNFKLYDIYNKTGNPNATIQGEAAKEALGSVKTFMKNNPVAVAGLAGLGVMGALMARHDAKKKNADKIRLQNRMIAEGMTPDFSSRDFDDMGINRALYKSAVARENGLTKRAQVGSDNYWAYKAMKFGGQKFDPANKITAKGEALNTIFRGKANPNLRFLARSGLIGDTASEIRGTLRVLNQPKIEQAKAQAEVAKDYNRALLAQQLLLDKQARQMKSGDHSEKDFGISDILAYPSAVANHDESKRLLYASSNSWLKNAGDTKEQNEIFKNIESQDKYYDAKLAESKRRATNNASLIGAGLITAGALALGAKALKNRREQHNVMGTAVGSDLGQNPMMPNQVGQPMQLNFSEDTKAIEEQLLTTNDFVQQLSEKYATLPTLESQQSFIIDLQNQGLPQEMIEAIQNRVVGNFSEDTEESPVIPVSMITDVGPEGLATDVTATTDKFDGTLPGGEVLEDGITLEERIVPLNVDGQSSSAEEAFESIV